MANGLYGKARESFLTKLIDWLNDTIKIVAIDTTQYTVAINTDQFLSDIPAGARQSNATLTAKTATLGTAGAANGAPMFTAVPNIRVAALVIYQDTGVAGTSRLIAYIDTATGIPYQSNGGDVNITFDPGPNRIFTL